MFRTLCSRRVCSCISSRISVTSDCTSDAISPIFSQILSFPFFRFSNSFTLFTMELTLFSSSFESSSNLVDIMLLRLPIFVANSAERLVEWWFGLSFLEPCLVILNQSKRWWKYIWIMAGYSGVSTSVEHIRNRWNICIWMFRTWQVTIPVGERETVMVFLHSSFPEFAKILTRICAPVFIFPKTSYALCNW